MTAAPVLVTAPPAPVTALTVGYLVAGLLGAALAGYAFGRREESPTVEAFAYFAAVAPVISLSLTGQTIATTLAGKLAWNFLSYIGWVFVGPSFLVFALQFVGERGWVSQRTVLGLTILPVLTLLLLLSAPFHDVFYTGVGLVRVDGWPVLVTDSGPWFWVHTAYEYGLVLFGLFLLGRFALTAAKPFRSQALVLLGAVLFMLSVNAVVIAFGVAPFKDADLTPLGFTIGIAAISLAIFRVRLIDVLPVARDRVFEELRSPVVVVGRNGLVLDANEAATDVLPPDATATPAREVLPPPLVESGLLDGQVDEAELELPVDGEPGWFLVRRQPFGPADEMDSGYALVFTDVTERREREERLGEFTSVVSHDLRNPLAVAQAHVELAEEVDDPEPHLEATGSALNRIDTIVDELLVLAREGERSIDTSPVDVEHVARAAWSTVETEDATLEVRSTGIVTADYDRLRRALENLFRNAVEHGGEDVTVTVEATDRGFAVADDGDGVPAEDRERVFDRGVTTSSNGTGLGLAIVAATAEAHGWSVAIEESEAGGARFVFVTDGDGGPADASTRARDSTPSRD